jgi:hypothetical protein
LHLHLVLLFAIFAQLDDLQALKVYLFAVNVAQTTTQIPLDLRFAQCAPVEPFRIPIMMDVLFAILEHIGIHPVRNVCHAQLESTVLQRTQVRAHPAQVHPTPNLAEPPPVPHVPNGILEQHLAKPVVEQHLQQSKMTLEHGYLPAQAMLESCLQLLL